MLAVALAATAAVVVQLRCVDAATEAARLAARDDLEGARRAAARLVPGGAEVVIEVRGDDVVARVRAAPLGSALPGIRVSAQALAAREPAPVAPVQGPDPTSDELVDGGEALAGVTAPGATAGAAG